MPYATDFRWSFEAEEHRVEQHLGRESLYLRGGTAIAEGVSLEHGVFEFDIAFPPGRDFHGGLWRAFDHQNYETFFVRPHQSGNPDATQYTPVFNDVFGWQLYHGEPFQVPLELRCDEWLRMRFAFAGGQAEISVGDGAPIVVPLKRGVAAGSVGLLGGVFAGTHFSRFSVEAIEPDPSVLAYSAPAAAAPGVIGAWEVSDPVPDGGAEVLDLTGRRWTRLESEPSGLTNLAQVNGLAGGRDTVFARALVSTAGAQAKRLEFGFSDRVRVFLNGRLLFSADDSYRSRDYRFLGSIGWWDALQLPLEEGRNELVLAVSEDFGGWGLQARFPIPPDSRWRVELLQHLLRDRERRVGGGNAAVDRALEQNLLDLVGGEPVAERRAEVHRELLGAVEGDEGRHRDRAARAPVESRPGPDLTPGIAGDQVLEVRGEFVGPRDRAVDVRIAEHFAPHLDPAVVGLVAHRASPRFR